MRPMEFWRSPRVIWATSIVGLVFLTGCAEQSDGGSVWQRLLADRSDPPRGNYQQGSQNPYFRAVNAANGQPLVVYGNDQLIGTASDIPAGALATQDGVLLNFENTDLREVVQVILSDLLGRNYLFDPRVNGQVTLQTVSPIASTDVLATLETILRQNGAAMVQRNDLINIVPVNEAGAGLRTPALAGGEIALRPGYAVLLAPLKSASASELAGILEPLAGPQTVVRFDAARNVLILAGNSQELNSLRETITLFDVDWMDGLSYGLFPLANANARDVVQELRTVMGGANSPLRDQATVEVVSRLNGVLVVAKRQKVLRDLEKWIGRLDRSSGADDEAIFVYNVENARASDIAEVLNDVFSNQGSGETGIAPGQSTTALVSNGGDGDGGQVIEVAGSGTDLGVSGAVRINANDNNNSLVIMAQPQDYERIQRIIRKLDTVPLQVMIDATIAEVTLTNQLSYGVQFFLQRGSTSVTSSQGDASIEGSFPGLVASLVRGDTTAILSALDSVTTLNVISSPRLMVLDNQSARLQVGDEVPVITNQQQATDSTANIINTIEFRETGVTLEVTPRVNSSGLVTLDILQETSNVVDDTTTGSLTPTISQRTVQSSIAVQDGNTILLGGMMQEQNSANKTGVPVLSDVPVVGGLFGGRRNRLNRTELIVLLTPRVIRNPYDVRDATEEMRRHLQAMTPQTYPTNQLTTRRRY